MKIYKALIPMLLIISNNYVLVKQAPSIETIKINIEKNNLSESFKQYDELCIRERDEILKEFKKDIYRTVYNVENNKISIEDGIFKLDEYSKLKDLDRDIKICRKQLNHIKASREAFERAKIFEEKKEYQKSLREYLKVIEDEKEEYEIAQQKIKEIKELLEKNN